jgi:hypothetical protein
VNAVSLSLKALGFRASTAQAPAWCAPVLVLLLVIQLVSSWLSPQAWREQTSPGDAPPVAVARLIGLGEAAALSYGINAYLQTFDSQAGGSVGLRKLDQDQLRQWLDLAIELHPQSSYSLLLASRIYASAASAEDAKKMLDLVQGHFLKAPNERWAWLAHAIHTAQHELKDMALAQRYARSLAQHTSPEKVPSWARQMEVFVLENSNQIEAAQQLIAGLIHSGQIKDQAELDFLIQRMGQMQIADGALADERSKPKAERGRNQP